LSIKEPARWDEREIGRAFPKTYREVVQDILSAYLVRQICNVGLKIIKEDEWSKNIDHFIFFV